MWIEMIFTKKSNEKYDKDKSFLIKKFEFINPLR